MLTMRLEFIFSDPRRAAQKVPTAILILFPVGRDGASAEFRRSRRVYSALRNTGIVDVLVCTRSYFEARRYLKASLPGTIIREGRLLHVVCSRSCRGHQLIPGQGETGSRSCHTAREALEKNLPVWAMS
jgi:hypothetical protein